MRSSSFPCLSLLRHRLLLLSLLLFSVGWLRASHNLAGQITYTYLGNNRVEITLTTYTDPSAQNVDRCTADLQIWNSSGSIKITDINGIPRQNGQFNVDPLFPAVTCNNIQMGEYILGTAKMNVYKAQYQFSGPGVYLIRYYDDARLDNIKNMLNSGSQALFLETTVRINPFLGAENSPVFLNHPLDRACTGKLFTHNPGGYDPDGDSLVYTLVPCRNYDGSNPPQTCNGFVYPDAIGGNGPFTINPQTGLITWNVPGQLGIYNVAYRVDEYRRGILIGSSFRDMAIYVTTCNNDPPIIEALQDTCIRAGETLTFPIKSWDPNFPLDSLYFQLNNNGGGTNNGPFSDPTNPATLIFNPPASLPIGTRDTVNGIFTWVTECDDVRPYFYQVDFYAHDNFGYYNAPGTQMLTANHITRIRVVPGPVTGLVVTPGSRAFDLSWNVHPCPNVTGYQIYRSFGPSAGTLDSVCCDQSPSSLGFTLIGTTTDRDSVRFTDDNNGQGFTEVATQICYVIVATFPNSQFSCPSNVECVDVVKDFAVITQDSIDLTAPAGTIKISWAKPREIDPIFPLPHTYRVLRAQGINGTAFTQVASGIPFTDTLYTDAGPATDATHWRYRVDLYDGNDVLISQGNSASSIFLNLTPGDQQLTLSWTESVPWENEEYFIYRAATLGGPYLLIDSVPATRAAIHYYVDDSLINFTDYCYYVLSRGQYPGEPDLLNPIWNASQKTCDQPRDQTPPCLSEALFDTTFSCEARLIAFDWVQPDSLCGGDLVNWHIYRADNETAPWVLIATLPDSITSYALTGLSTLADCYGVSAVDSNGNESEKIVFCFENCPILEGANVFTPNGDGINDYFAPFRERFVTVRSVQIWDRWGKLVYTTTTVPNILNLWDGRNTNGADVPDGVYYYVIEYDEERLPGPVSRPAIYGHVTLLR